MNRITQTAYPIIFFFGLILGALLPILAVKSFLEIPTAISFLFSSILFLILSWYTGWKIDKIDSTKSKSNQHFKFFSYNSNRKFVKTELFLLFVAARSFSLGTLSACLFLIGRLIFPSF